MKAEYLSDDGVRNIVYETIVSAVNEWKRAAVYLYKNTGEDPLKIDHAFDERFRCNKRIMSKVGQLRDAERFFKGKIYEFYSKTLDCYVEPNRLLEEINKRALEDALK